MHEQEAEKLRQAILFQFGISEGLLQYHLKDISDDEALWQPHGTGLTVRQQGGRWVADFPETEDYTIGSPNIAWLTWHILSFFTMTFEHSFDSATLTQTDVDWPGDVGSATKEITAFCERWKTTKPNCPPRNCFRPPTPSGRLQTGLFTTWRCGWAWS